MEQQPNNTNNQNERSDDNRPGGQSDRNRNRNRNRNRGRNKDRSGQPRGEQEAATADNPADDQPVEVIDGNPDTPVGTSKDKPAADIRPTSDHPNRTNHNERTRQGQPNAAQPRSVQERDGRPPRDQQRQPGNERNRDNQERTPHGVAPQGVARSERQQERGRSERPERGGGERFERGGSERSERPERERSVYDRAEDVMPERPRPERQERYEPMAVDRYAGASVFEDDDDQTGRSQRPPLSEASQQERLVIGISLGDFNGVGPEVILKALQYNQLQKLCTPVIYGSMRVLNRYRNLLNLKDWNLNGIQQVEQASHKMTNVITCFSDMIQLPPAAEGEAPPPPQPATDIQPGKVTPEAGLAAFACLTRAVEDLKAGKLHALVTAPINKHNIQSDVFKFPGHTEYLANAFGVPDDLMFMVSDILKVGVVTGHVPISRVKQGIHKGAIAQKLEMMTRSLKQDFGISRPKIAVLGLNPHAGERGLLGSEENEIIIPLINELRQKGQLIYGPFPADGFFGTRSYRKYDAVLAMYHDQGLIPFKAIAFEEGVNFTAGLPAVRTSPDHGTAYDIAGKGLADETSMVQAIYTACDVARRRKEYQELEANALKK
ncbi:MAG TPA: 4-hydroxythreonine-4-phosphate dehydrogenase PdxA [Fibrella sp.]